MTEVTPVALTAQQMFDYRRSALALSIEAAAADQPVAQTLHNAGIYLGFLLNGTPIGDVPSAIVESSLSPTGVAPATGKPKAARSAAKAEQAAATAPAASTAQPAAAQQSAPASNVTNIATAVKPAQELQAPPVTTTDAALALKALVQGKGRDAGVGLLAEYKVAQMSQIPPAQLAGFVQKAKALLTAPAAAEVVANDPMAGLV